MQDENQSTIDLHTVKKVCQ